MNAECIFPIPCVAVGLLLLVGGGCDQPAPSGSLVLTQAPVSAALPPDADVLEARYPIGSRVVLRETPFDARHERVLSGSLVAAGSPVVSYDGQRVFFVGKAGAAGDWQIYETVLAGWGPRVLTSMPGGAMSPILLPNGSLVFISPVPKVNAAKAIQRPSALFVQSPEGQPRQLTFSSSPVVDSTVLSDGRILFVMMQYSTSNAPPDCALYTINNDGTEITAFAGPEDTASAIQRPRLLADGRVVFLASTFGSSAAEFVRVARPFQSRAPLFPGVTARVNSVEAASHGDLLVCAEHPSGPGTSLALFRVSPDATVLGAPLLADPAWNDCEAVEVSPHRQPMGRISSVDLTKSTGKILCLDANFSSDHPGGTTPAATRVRVLAETPPGNVRALGEVPVQTDGSFLAEVPSDVPLGFEALDENGRVLLREEPMLWVRPGENRSCIGCHEPRNRSPRNHRPLAVGVSLPCLSLKSAKLAQKETNR